MSYRDFVMSNADYAALDRLLREKELEEMKLSFSGKSAPTSLKAELKRLRGQKSALEKELGINAERLLPRYFCSKCSDTGRYEGKICECAIRLREELLYSDSSFVCKGQQFSLSTETDEENNKAIEICRRFADAYPSTQILNIIIFGAVATGKTFLAGSICNRLAERGLSFCALTAFGLARDFLNEHTSPAAQRTGLSELTDAPLLVIDDLGSEPFYNNVSREYLFALLDERAVGKRGTVVTTNLSLAELCERYGERVFSRRSAMKNFIDTTHKNLAVKLAETREEIEKARVLRFDELINKSNPNIPYSQCFDDSDFIYDHLIVIDRDNGSVVGTYRLGRREQLEKIGDFYTNVKFNVDSLMAAEGEVLELSRMAIRESYRDGSVIKLLWKGLFAYCARFDVKWLFGIISLPTTEPDDALNFLSYINNGLLTEEFDLFAREPVVRTKLLSADEIDVFKAKKEMHPILKAYLSMGCKFARGAHYDLGFLKSIDVMIVIDFKKVNPKYIELVTRM